MKIAVDYDDTYTAAPVLFKAFVLMAIQHGHEVKFVTYRDKRYARDNEDILADAYELGIEVIFTGGRQKSNLYNADIWIDDMPITIPDAILLGNMYDGCLINNDMEQVFDNG